MVKALIVTCAALAAAACGSEADDASAPTLPICDGSADLTLRIFYSGGGMDYPGSAVRRENGAPSLAVDGQCRYFMSGGWLEDRQSSDLGWRQGILPDELERALEQRVGSDLEQTYGCGDGFIVDAPSSVIANTHSALTCPGGGGQSVLDVFAFVRQHARELWAAGQALQDDLHIAVVEPRDGGPVRKYDWPSGLDLHDDLEPVSLAAALEGRDRRRRVPAAEAAPFRAIREQYLRDTEPASAGYTAAGIPVTDGELSATLFMRDALPYEDEQGILPLPGE
ncbi:MAG TPA: hypothetical protein VMG12_28370 [Polyangiaceae bacterium]|nr:hypothetical protein [Polyangiaceae bacterium]